MPAMHLSLDQVSIRYPGQPVDAVHQVSFGLAAGDIGVLLGPSGCGKTTLLRAVAGLSRWQAVRRRLAGQTLSRPAGINAAGTAPDGHGVPGSTRCSRT